MKKLGLVLLSILMLVGCSSTSPTPKNFTVNMGEDGKASGTFMNVFDTYFQVIMYEKSEKKFTKQMQMIYDDFSHYNELFDKYHNYDGLNNVKTINDNAGIIPVEVDDELFEMIELAIDLNKQYSHKVNIALGPVLKIWHHYREDLNDGSIPTLEELQEAAQYCDIDKVVLDKENKTVYLEDKNMSLDVGCIAKGFAAQKVYEHLVAEGVDDFLISAGGNVICHGKRAKLAPESNLSKTGIPSREYYTIDFQSPGDGAYADVKAIAGFTIQHDETIVTSGDYQRNYIGSDGVYYHHLIDGDTLYPPHYFRAVSIITKDSGVADFISSATFLMTVEEGKAFINSLEDTEAIWLLNDGTVTHTAGLVEGVNTHFYLEDVK